MKTTKIALLIILTILSFGAFAQEKETTVKVGGAEMYSSKNIIENAEQSKDHTILVAAIKAAGLVETLQGYGPFTVFAPVNTAFNRLPHGTVESLMKPENKAMLTSILTYHVIQGNFDSKNLAKRMKAGNGTLELKTMNGAILWVTMAGDKFVLTDEKGTKCKVQIKDVYQSNGVIHVIDAVMMPK
jgi:uncharacterized surface protein with fasciclin (FAS1) repeats